MKQRLRARKTSELSEPINRQLEMYAAAAKAGDVSALALVQASPKILAYALAAGAAGIGALASVPSAEAKIVYTKVHVTLPNYYYDKKYYLDLNRDGQNDFVFFGSGTCDSGCTFDVNVGRSGAGNGIIATKHGGRGPRINAVALRAGAQIGPAPQVRQFYGGGVLASLVTNSKGIFWYGQWGNGGKGLKNGYLGLQFQIKEKTHYGWARVTVNPSHGRRFATLTGYAYETIPGKPIIAGKTKGADVATVLPSSATHRTTKTKPLTLGELAVGR